MNSDVVRCEPGDVISLTGSGGGGYGDPFTRPVELVVGDVRRRFVSPLHAKEAYGVVVAADLVVDEEATRALRAERPAAGADFFAYCENRSAFERLWTRDRYAELTRFLSTIPVAWRFFAKHRIFAAMAASNDGQSMPSGLALLIDDLLREYPDLCAQSYTEPVP